MGTTKTTDPFSNAGAEAVAEKMDMLASRPEGKAWVTLEPDVDRRSVATGSALWRVFSARGPVIPSVSWVPVLGARQATHHHELGISHGTGGKTVERLQRNGVEIPSEWRIGQDHKKRGLVLGVPPTEPALRTVRFAMDVLSLLSPFTFGDAYFALFFNAD